MSELVVVTDEGPIRILRMNRAEKKNALTSPMYAAMAAAIENAGSCDTVRCLLITGAPGAFSAGNDLQEFLAAAQTGAGLGPSVLAFLHALVHAKKPIVAAVCGLAVGIGTTMLMHCDFVVAADDARFSTPFVQLGLVPEAASSLIAPRLMGYRTAFSLLVMGRQFSADEAKAAGLVNMVVAPSAVDTEATRAAREIAALPPEAVAATRALMRGSPDELARRIQVEAELFKERLTSPEARAAFETFFARKR
jgi:enoyl-CoA hydratase/carnithine racemase